jgi:tetratricopeptide (TPR) repeat protein
VRERFQSDSLINTLSSSLGNAYEGSKNYKKAIEFFEKMLKVDTTDNFLRYKIADTYLSSKDYKTALIKFKELIKRDTINIKSYIQIGKIYYENYNDYKEAKSYLAKAIENIDDSYLYGSEFIDLYYILGMIAVRENRITEALMYYMDLKDIYSYSPEDKKKKNNLYKEILKFDD